MLSYCSAIQKSLDIYHKIYDKLTHLNTKYHSFYLNLSFNTIIILKIHFIKNQPKVILSCASKYSTGV